MFFNNLITSFLFAFFILSTQVLSAQDGKHLLQKENLRQCLDSIYNIDFEYVREKCSLLPDSLQQIKDMFEVFCLRWEEVPIQHSKKRNVYVKKINKAISLFKNLDSENSTDVFIYISAQLLLAEFYFASHDYFQAIWHGKRAYPLMMKSFDKNRTEPEFAFVKGLYLYYIDYYNQKGIFYKTALSLFRKGNRKLGLESLKSAIKTESLATTEAYIYLAHIYLRLENKPFDALLYTHKLVERYPKNFKFRELRIENLFASGNYSEGEILLADQLKINNPYYKIPALFYLGCAYLDNKRDKANGTKAFDECIQLMNTHKLHEEYKEKIEDKLQSIKN